MGVYLCCLCSVLLLPRSEVEIRVVAVWIMTLCTLMFKYQHLDELTASIFRVEECRQQIPLKNWCPLGATEQRDRRLQAGLCYGQ
jgi:hypothetical protein